MKVIFLNRYFHPDISATSQILASLAFHLAGQGAEVHVITSRQRYGDPAAALPASETMGGVQVHRVATSRFGRRRLVGRAFDYASFHLSAVLRLTTLAKRGDIVVAKTDPPLISVPAAIVAGLKGARLVNWLQDLFPEVADRLGMKLFLAGPVIRACRTYALRRAEMNIVLGERMRSLVQGFKGVRIEVIHNWADGDRIRPMPANTSGLRKEWGLTGKFVVAYSGNLGRAHEFETILAAASALRENDRIAFLFIGDGHHRQQVALEARKRSLANVFFRPYQPDSRLSESLGAADLHLTVLLPALEGLIVPSKIYGILAAGRPALHVGDPTGELAEILRSAEAGFTVPTGDALLLASRIVELAGNPVLVARMGINARAAFDACYNQNLAFDRWKRVLGEVGAVEAGKPVNQPQPRPAPAIPASGKSPP